MCTGINIDQNVAIDFQTHASRVQPSKARVGIMYGTIADDKRVHVEFVYEVGTFVDAAASSSSSVHLRARGMSADTYLTQQLRCLVDTAASRSHSDLGDGRKQRE